MSETISDYKERCRICFTDFTTAESGIELDGILIEQLEHLISFVCIYLNDFALIYLVNNFYLILA